MKGGRKDQFFFCLLEFYPNEQRWFLKSLLQVKDEEGVDGDTAIRNWLDEYQLKSLIVDFPLSQAACANCEIECPGMHQCPVENVQTVYREIDKLLDEDLKRKKENPKKYEQERNKDDEIDFKKDIMDVETTDHILSRSFKRRLKKGFLPYWNRPVDLWIWCNYYEQLLDLFNISYDSFGNTSLMMISRFDFLKRHFPSGLKLYESNSYINLIELLRAKIILKRDILNLSDIDFNIEARLNIICQVEKKLNIFIYDHDKDILVKNPRAFNSFLLAICGRNLSLTQMRALPLWAEPEKTRFVFPSF